MAQELQAHHDEHNLQLLQAAKAALPNTSQMQVWHQRLTTLVNRLAEQRRLIAVFGAFSAGKSSLINALVQDQVLTVSPNPTTATVTHVQAGLVLPKDVSNHETALVTAKTEADMWMDVSQAFAHLHIDVTDFADALRKAQELKIREFTPNARKFVSYLKSFADGYEQMAPKLGLQWAITESDLHKYTADESLACFLQRVDLAHPASLLESGLILADTPGVDSIHRRHTDVAFDYMRSADAVLFVLYYTHAFSRTDKNFLMQLAGVEDVAGTNKLFVVINAVDLATSEEELADVRQRVTQELRQLGIAKPRIFEVSSQMAAVTARLQSDPENVELQQFLYRKLGLAPDAPLPSAKELMRQSGVPELASSLETYIREQSQVLANQAVRRLLRDVANDVRAQMMQSIRRRDMSAAEQSVWTSRIREMASALTLELERVESGDHAVERTLLGNWDELIYHIGRRVQLRLSTLFRESFHPGRFRLGTNPKVHLEEAASEFSAALETQIEVESRTFLLRAVQQVDQATRGFADELHARFGSLELGTVDVVQSMDNKDESVTNELAHAFRAEISAKNFTPFFRHFSSSKQFFEQGGQQAMRADFEPVAERLIHENVSKLTTEVRVFAVQALRERLLALLDEWRKQAEQVLRRDNGRVEDVLLAEWSEAFAWFEPYAQE